MVVDLITVLESNDQAQSLARSVGRRRPRQPSCVFLNHITMAI
jgi:hypothetical protein